MCFELFLHQVYVNRKLYINKASLLLGVKLSNPIFVTVNSPLPRGSDWNYSGFCWI